MTAYVIFKAGKDAQGHLHHQPQHTPPLRPPVGQAHLHRQPQHPPSCTHLWARFTCTTCSCKGGRRQPTVALLPHTTCVCPLTLGTLLPASKRHVFITSRSASHVFRNWPAPCGVAKYTACGVVTCWLYVRTRELSHEISLVLFQST